jgi:hypothetical protein
VALCANFKIYSRSAKGGEKGDPNRNPWLAKMAFLVKTQNLVGQVTSVCHLFDATSDQNIYYE